MVLVIIVTGNHLWLDAVAGAVCVLIGRVLAHRMVECLLLYQRWRDSSVAATLGSFSDNNDHDEKLSLIAQKPRNYKFVDASLNDQVIQILNHSKQNIK